MQHTLNVTPHRRSNGKNTAPIRWVYRSPFHDFPSGAQFFGPLSMRPQTINLASGTDQKRGTVGSAEQSKVHHAGCPVVMLWTAAPPASRLPLMAQSGSATSVSRLPLSGVKQTWHRQKQTRNVVLFMVWLCL